MDFLLSIMKELFFSWKDRLRFQGDYVILIITVFLTLISLYAVYSSTGKIVSHFFHLLLCFFSIFITYRIDYKKLSLFAPFFLLIAAALLLFTLFTGSDDNRGISLFGIEFQTFYLIGFLVIFYIAKFLGSHLNKEEPLSPKSSYTLIFILLFFIGGIAVANISTAIILIATSLVVLFVGNFKLKYFVILLSIILVGGSVFIFTGAGRGETFKGRVHYYLTEDNSKGYGDQIILAKAAIARSGFKPTGPGQGVIKNVLPEKETDYVYATVFEEIGILLGLIILFAYFILFTRAWKISNNSEGAFAKLLAIGIGFWFTCQGLVHIAVNTELLPATGQTLPFISRGGSSLIFSGIMIGTLLNISKYSKKEKGTEQL